MVWISLKFYRLLIGGAGMEGGVSIWGGFRVGRWVYVDV